MSLLLLFRTHGGVSEVIPDIPILPTSHAGGGSTKVVKRRTQRDFPDDIVIKVRKKRKRKRNKKKVVENVIEAVSKVEQEEANLRLLTEKHIAELTEQENKEYEKLLQVQANKQKIKDKVIQSIASNIREAESEERKAFANMPPEERLVLEVGKALPIESLPNDWRMSLLNLSNYEPFKLELSPQVPMFQESNLYVDKRFPEYTEAKPMYFTPDNGLRVDMLSPERKKLLLLILSEMLN